MISNFNIMYWNHRKFYSQCLNTFSFPVNRISILEKTKIKQSFELFLHMQLKFEIIWTKIGQVVSLRNINFSKTPNIYIYIYMCVCVCVCVCVQFVKVEMFMYMLCFVLLLCDSQSGVFFHLWKIGMNTYTENIKLLIIDFKKNSETFEDINGAIHVF